MRITAKEKRMIMAHRKQLIGSRPDVITNLYEELEEELDFDSEQGTLDDIATTLEVLKDYLAPVMERGGPLYRDNDAKTFFDMCHNGEQLIVKLSNLLDRLPKLANKLRKKLKAHT